MPTRSVHRAVSALLFISLVTLTAGCGGGGGTSGGTGSSATTTQTTTGSTTSSTGTVSAAYTLRGGTDSQAGQTYSASNTDESGVYVTSGGNLTLTNCTVTTSGNTSSADNSSFYGLNAGVLAESASTIVMSGGTVTTTGTGANGVFSTGSGTTVSLTGVTINCSGQLGHGVDATYSGVLNLTDVDITTYGANGATIATDRGGGTIDVTRGTFKTYGTDSPGIYSTGAITVRNATLTADASEAVVIEGSNSVTLSSTALSCAKKWGVMIYQSMSGDATGSTGTFTMTGGSLSAAVGPLFYVTNATGVISVTGATLTATSGTLLSAAAGNWGTSGSNGGTITFTADSETLVGNVVSDSISSISMTLQNSTTLTGTVNSAAVSLDSTSTWTVTGESHVTTLTDASGISGTSITNIVGNGNNVYYKSSLTGNAALGGATYSLSGGGQLIPE